MNDTITVRDHSRPCEHGSLWSHWDGRKGKWWQGPDCLGGTEIILQRREDGSWIEVVGGDPGSRGSLPA